MFSAFNVFINKMIVKLKLNRIGCSIGSSFLGCVMYADNIILLSSSVAGLQGMLDICFETCIDLHLKFNCNKSFCIVFGPAAKFTLAPMLLGQDHIQWVNSINYLGVKMVSGKTLSFDIDPMLKSFYLSCNCIFSKTAKCDQLLQLRLQETYCLPVISYAAAVISLSKSHLQRLNAGWNSVYRRIFGFNKWNSVKYFIHGLGFLDLKHIFMLRKAKFFWKLRSTDSLLLSNLYHLFMYVDRNDIWFSSLDKNLFVFSNIYEIKEFITNRFACICSEHYEC